ncbi:MAG: hypothetical protein M5U31_16250 [Acidimicrobiia bacterium]|nr:hypothetical protein [Acidimicrobiia bacterium]
MSIGTMQELAPHLLHGAALDRSSNTIWEGSGDEVVLDDLESSARTLSDELGATANRRWRWRPRTTSKAASA